MKKHGCQKWISEIAADNISSVVSEIRPNVSITEFPTYLWGGLIA